MIKCYECDKENLSNNTVALNKKIIGRNVEKIQCLTCLSEYLEVTEEELLDKIEEYKYGGCELFS